MTEGDDIRVCPIGPELAPRLAALFDRSNNDCYCRYFHFDGDKYAWQDRLANAPELSRAELIEDVRGRSERALGVIALSGDEAVGWLKLTPARLMHKLYDQRLYRHLPCLERDPSGVYTLGCFFVQPDKRGQGVAHRLVVGAIALAKDLGASALEALPRGGASPSEAELWMGKARTLEALGFEPVHDFEPYPVLRLSLSSNA